MEEAMRGRLECKNGALVGILQDINESLERFEKRLTYKHENNRSKNHRKRA
jgi:dynactin complex subunit